MITCAGWCWGPDIHTECLFFFCLWICCSLVAWTSSPFGSGVNIAHLLIELQGCSPGALRGWLKSPFQIHTRPAVRSSRGTQGWVWDVLEHGDRMMAFGGAALAPCAGPAVLLPGWAQPGVLPHAQLWVAAVPCPARRVNVMAAQHNFSFQQI